MKVSLKSTTGSKIIKPGTAGCFLLAEDIRNVACGLAYAAHALSKERKSQAQDKAVQVVDVSVGLRTAAARTESVSKTLKARGYDKLAKEAKSIGTAAAKLNRDLGDSDKRPGSPLGRVKAADVEKLENSVKKLKDRMQTISSEAWKTCRGYK